MNRNSKPHLTVIEPNAAETISNEPDDREEEAPAEPFQPTEAHAAAAQPEMSLFEACRSVFGDARVLEGRPDDRQFPPELPRRSGADPASTETIGVRCGAGAEGHLVAVVLSDDELARDFQTRNPTLYQVLTRWESSTLVWLRVGDPAPRNLNTGIVIWISEGVIPLEDPPAGDGANPSHPF